LMQTVARDSEDARNGCGLRNLRHVTILAALFVAIVAMEPFEIGHLFRQLADGFASCSTRDGVERVARGAQLRVANMEIVRRPKAASRGPHDALIGLLNVERTVLRVILLVFRRIHDKAAVKTFARAKFFLSNLMTHGARNAVFGLASALFLFIEGKMYKHLAQMAVQFCLVPRNRHVADRALVLNG